ncbi:MAG TPA: gliding motility-associated C-terminal domain-containing protein [Bacteroidia bacterium]|nr:gliding motility-associated C-terminal domain-containing protein [Bacteroidia bacterium]
MWLSAKKNNTFGLLSATSAIGLLLTVFFSVTALYGQNLCPNPGFEQLSGCPLNQHEVTLAAPWMAPGDTADLFHACHVNNGSCSDVGVPDNIGGYATAHGGAGYAGFVARGVAANERTYLSAPLSSPLVTGQLYEVRGWFRRASYSKYALNSQGIVLSTGPLMQTGGQYIPLTPQIESAAVLLDTSAWTKVSSFYTAFGGEAYITIGNFRDDAATTSFAFAVPAAPCSDMDNRGYYFVDDIAVIPITETISITGDTIICEGASAALTGITNTTGWWSDLSTPADTIYGTNTTITVSPVSTTTYLWHGLQLTDTVTVQVLTPPTVMLPANDTLCEGDSMILDATCSGCSYNWSTGATTAMITIFQTGSYIITVNNGGCSARDTFLLEVLSNPVPPLDPEGVICPDQNEMLDLNAGTGASFLWLPGNDTTQMITVSEAGVYTVTVIYANGCSHSASTTVIEVCPDLVFIPSAFTPNKDGKNETFTIQASNILNFKIILFNRWGQTVFTSTDPAFSWDGTYEGGAAPGGIYTYRIQYDAPKAGSSGTRRVNREGTVLVVR